MSYLLSCITTTRSRLLAFGLLIPVLALATTAHTAEETELLTITGDLIDVLPIDPEAIRPTLLIDRYYARLDQAQQQEVAEMRATLIALIPDYNIAFAAADTAEVNSVLSEVAYRWALLRTFHAAHFTQAACVTLEQAYGDAYRLLQ